MNELSRVLQITRDTHNAKEELVQELIDKTLQKTKTRDTVLDLADCCEGSLYMREQRRSMSGFMQWSRYYGRYGRRSKQLTLYAMGSGEPVRWARAKPCCSAFCAS